MLATVAVLPQPPLLVPELATGADAETAPLRDACVAAAARLGAVAHRWIAVGADDTGRRTVDPAARGTFAGFGVDVVVALDTRPSPGPATEASAPGAPSDDEDARLAHTERATRAHGDPDSRKGRAALHATAPDAAGSDAAGSDAAGSDAAGSDAPASDAAAPSVKAPDAAMALPLLVAGWVAGAAGVQVTIRGELLAPDATPQDCADLGAALAAECAASPGPVGLLVVGDGAATHTEKAPRHLDERAGPFDCAVADALAAADPPALAALDPALAAELTAVGRAPWQVLAAAVADGDWAGELLYSAAPYGVAYHVAVWTRRP